MGVCGVVQVKYVLSTLYYVQSITHVTLYYIWSIISVSTFV